jgi:hypothetical protein
MSEHKYLVGALGPILYMDLSGVAPYTNFTTVVCLEDFATKDTVATINADSYCGPDKQAGIADFSITGSGQHALDPDTGRVSGPSLRVALRSKTRCGYKIQPAIPAKGDEIETGTCFINDLSSNYALSAVSKFTFGLQPYGTSTLNHYQES